MAKGPKKAKQKVPDKLKPPDTLSAEPSNAKFPEEQIELAAVEAPKETAAKGHIDPNGQSRQDIQAVLPTVLDLGTNDRTETGGANDADWGPGGNDDDGWGPGGNNDDGWGPEGNNDDGWGPGADAANDLWGAAPHTSPVVGGIVGGGSGNGWAGESLDRSMPGGVRRNVGGDNHGPPVQTTGGTKNGSGRNESSFVIPPSSALAQPPQVTHAVPSLNVNTKIASTAWGNPSSSAVDWNETGQDSGNPSVTWADPVQSLMGDPAPVPQAPTTASIQSGAWKHWRSEAQGSGKSQVAQPTDGKQYQRTFSQQQAATQQQEADRHQQQRRQWQQQQQHQLLGQALQQHRVQLQRQQQFAGSRTSKNQQQQFRRPQQIEQANSWGSSGWDNTGLSANWVEPIPEEEEEENDGYDHEEDEDYNEDADGSGYSDGHGYGHHVRTSPSVSYVTRTSPASAQTPHTQPFLPTMVSSTQLWLPDGPTSKTMAMASGRSTTTVFELAAPRNGMGEVRFTDSYGDALVPAQRALFSKKRPVKDRIYWSFNPDKDPRVASLIKWIHAASNGLAEIGLQKFLQTGNRGALISNADYRVNHSPSLPAQPAFDWITLGQLHTTLDRILQESVALYDPGLQVIIFVFLLSRTGNSMAVWRRKIMIPDSVRQMHQQEILAAKGRLEQDYPVYVEELPPKDEPRPPEPKKGRIRNVLSKRKWFKWLS